MLQERTKKTTGKESTVPVAPSTTASPIVPVSEVRTICIC